MRCLSTGFEVALRWLWGGFVLRSLCLVYAYNMALGWLWVALRGLPPLFLLSTFYFLLLPECGFGWLKRSRFRVQGSRFDVRCSSDNVCPFLSRTPNRLSTLRL